MSGQKSSGDGSVWSTGSGSQHPNAYAFAALKQDGSVVTWGFGAAGGDSSAVADDLSSGVAEIFSARNAFAALKDDGSVVTWGAATAGGDSSEVIGELSNGVMEVFSASLSFAALKDDGSVVTWGADSSGGDSSLVTEDLSGGVTQVFSTGQAFAALKEDGSVVTWGANSFGGDSSAVAGDLSGGVTEVFSNGTAFVALKEDGSVVTWGSPSRGGDISAVAEDLSGGITEVFSTSNAFAALKEDGSIVTWGNSDWGGDSSAVADDLSSGVTDVHSSRAAFAALKEDGSVVTWGADSFGGGSSAASGDLSGSVTEIFSTGFAFAALKEDGSVTTWGSLSAGGDSSAVASELSGGVTEVFSTGGAFAALKEDGSVVTWGWGDSGGESSEVVGDLSGGVTEIFSTETAFAAVKEDGSVVTWGEDDSGGDSSAVADQLSSEVLILASPFEDQDIGTGANDGDDPQGPVIPDDPEAPEDPETPPSLYQPSTEDLEIAARIVAYQRLGAQPDDYYAFGSAGSASTYILEQGYEFEVLSQGSADEGFFAVGMTSPTAEPILAIRGSSNADDWASNFEPDGVGRSQVDESWDDIVDWIGRSTEQGQALNITGHSQGGAQTQYIASRLTSDEQPELSELSLGTLATFNSPGIAQSDALQFNNSDVRGVAHFVSSGDVVSLTGEAFIEGSVEYLGFDKGYSDGTTSLIEYVSTAHTGFWAQQSLNQEIGSVFTFEANQFVEVISVREDIFTIEDFNSSQDLNSPAFSYVNPTSGNFDAEYNQWLNDVDNSLAYLSTWGPILDGPIVRELSSEENEREILSEVEQLCSDIEGLSWADPDGRGLVERIVTEDIRVLYGDNFERILEISDLIGSDINERAGISDDGTAPAIYVSGATGGILSSEAAGSIFNVGAGIDEVEVSGDRNLIFGTQEDLNGDQISGFGESDLLFYSDAQFTDDQLRVEEGSAILNVDSDSDGEVDSVVTLEGEYDIEAFKVTDMESGTGITYEPEEPVVPCFTSGSLLMTKRGLVPAEDISEGDVLVTRDHGYQPVKWIGRRALSREELIRRTHLAPILIKRGTLGDGIPERDMMVSPQHRMLWQSASSSVFFGDPEIFVAAKHLTYLPGFEKMLVDSVVYLHFLFDQHEVVLADGAWSESFNPGQNVLTGMDQEQSTELFELFPDLREKGKKSAFQSARRSLKRHEAKLLV